MGQRTLYNQDRSGIKGVHKFLKVSFSLRLSFYYLTSSPYPKSGLKILLMEIKLGGGLVREI